MSRGCQWGIPFTVDSHLMVEGTFFGMKFMKIHLSVDLSLIFHKRMQYCPNLNNSISPIICVLQVRCLVFQYVSI